MEQELQQVVGIYNLIIELGIRFWAKTEKLFDARYKANLAIYNALDEGGIEIPYPQAEIKIIAGDVS